VWLQALVNRAWQCSDNVAKGSKGHAFCAAFAAVSIIFPSALIGGWVRLQHAHTLVFSQFIAIIKESL